MSRVFVTGATGVLGRRVVPRLVAAGHDVSAVVRSTAKAELVLGQGARPVVADLFDPNGIAVAIAGHDAVAHLATSIPTGAAVATKRAWKTNDRLRRDASAVLARAAIEAGIGRFVQESITFPYVDRAERWIDETVDREYVRGDRTTVDAEAAAAAVTQAGGAGVVLRFAMFMATDSAHMQTFATMAGRGIWGFFGADDRHISFVDADDAAAAVVAALDAPAGIYNVAEADPVTRGEHRTTLAAAAGRQRLRDLPGLVEKMGGAAAESLARSHRISSASLNSATGWTPAHRPIDRWRELT
ncbi:NAD(P)H-binding protein [Ilumatobacter sp.]|uniref:NAD(P)H-binding protein n=1 Tax=Ilumatobacter sp. TaxID=1967498 RepID=UPI003AF9A254